MNGVNLILRHTTNGEYLAGMVMNTIVKQIQKAEKRNRSLGINSNLREKTMKVITATKCVLRMQSIMFLEILIWIGLKIARKMKNQK